MILAGIWCVISYFRESDELKYFRLDLFVGVVLVLGGILVIQQSARLIAFISMVVAIWIILRGILDLQVSFNLRFVQAKGWWIALIAALLTILLGVAIFINPFESAEVTMMATGILMLVSSIFDLGQSIGILITLREE